MLHFVSDIWSCQIVVKTLRVVLYLNLLLCPTFVLPLNELFVELVSRKGLNKRVKLLFLVVPGRSSRVYKYFGANDCSKDLGFFGLVLLYVNDDEQMKVLAFIVVGRRRKFHGAEVDLTIDHLHFAIAPDAHIEQGNFV